MRVVLFGGGNRGSKVLSKLLDLKEDVAGTFYFDVDSHEKIWYEKIQDIATVNGIPSFKHGSISENETTQILRRLNPEIVFVISWRYKIPKDQYSIPIKGCIVFHDSLLPKYRGFAPMNWAIINGEKKTGVTMFYIADEIDAGDIIAQRILNINTEDNAKTMDQRLTYLYLELLEENLPLIAKNKASRIPQDHNKATYTCKRIPEDGLIRWSKSANEIYNLIRGLTDPYPGAFSFVKVGSHIEKLYIWSASLDNSKRKYVGCVSGRVIEILSGKGIRILTGDGTLVIEDVELESSKKKVRADQIIKSVKTTFGANIADIVNRYKELE